MHYEKQKNGVSWLFYEKLAPRGRRKLALVHFNPLTWKLERVERLDANDEELSRVEEAIPSIKLPKLKATAKAMRIAVICEGETESRYVRELCEGLGIKDRVDVSVSVDKDPGTVFQQVASRMLFQKATGVCPFDEAWLVFDRDSHFHFDEAVGWAPSVPFVRTAFTNPCLEFWFLLHYKEFDGQLPRDRQVEKDVREERIEHEDGLVEYVIHRFVKEEPSPAQCLNTLKSYYPGYVKNGDKVFRKYCGCIKDAYERARALPPPGVGQGSQLPDFIDRLAEMAGVSVDEAFALWAKAGEGEKGFLAADEVLSKSGVCPKKGNWRTSAEAIVGLAKRAIAEPQTFQLSQPLPKSEDFLVVEHFFGQNLGEKRIKTAEVTYQEQKANVLGQYLFQTLFNFLEGKSTINARRTRVRIVASLRLFKKSIARDMCAG